MRVVRRGPRTSRRQQGTNQREDQLYLYKAGERAHDGALQEVMILGELPQLGQALKDEVSVALDLRIHR
jgi:hypothetical protein